MAAQCLVVGQKAYVLPVAHVTATGIAQVSPQESQGQTVAVELRRSLGQLGLAALDALGPEEFGPGLGRKVVQREAPGHAFFGFKLRQVSDRYAGGDDTQAFAVACQAEQEGLHPAILETAFL